MARELTTSISLTRQIAVYEQKDYKYFAKEAHNRSEPGWTVCQMEKLIEHQTNITVAIGEVIELKYQVTNPPANLKVNMIYYFLEDNIDWDPHYIGWLGTLQWQNALAILLEPKISLSISGVRYPGFLIEWIFCWIE